MGNFLDADNYLFRKEAGDLRRTDNPRKYELVVPRHQAKNFEEVQQLLASKFNHHVAGYKVSSCWESIPSHFVMEDTYEVPYAVVELLATLSTLDC